MSSEMGLRGQNSRTTDEVLNARLKQVETALGNPNAEEQSLVLMSTLVGALVLARSVESAELAARILDVVRGSLKAEVVEQKKAGR
jgi:TetR/AcrR family transcriptional repressor of nem operon